MAKRGTMKTIGHNFADSFASGMGLLGGHYEMDVFAEAAASTEGFIQIVQAYIALGQQRP